MSRLLFVRQVLWEARRTSKDGARLQDRGEEPVALLLACRGDAEVARIAEASDEVSRGGLSLGGGEVWGGRQPPFSC